MSIEKQLKSYQSEFQLLLEEYFRKKKEKMKKVDILALEATEKIGEMVLGGGKRIRPILVCQGYLLAGGKNEDLIRQAALSIELMHAFLLIHDDIIDQDKKRHNLPTINESYSRLGKSFFHSSRESEHFGNSMALVVGDMAYSMANEILFEAGFSANTILMALKKMQEIVYKTIPGEMLDILLQARRQASEEEILLMYDGKTARYTFEGPLHLGVCLAGQAENKSLLKILSGYALPLGQAFQIRDDILGVFGNEEKIGKPIGSDIKEGKQTLLLNKAIELGNQKEKEEIFSYLGKKDIEQSELERIREIIEKTGALEYSKNKAKKLVEMALKELKKISFLGKKERQSIVFLKDLAKYIIFRGV